MNTGAAVVGAEGFVSGALAGTAAETVLTPAGGTPSAALFSGADVADSEDGAGAGGSAVDGFAGAEEDGTVDGCAGADCPPENGLRGAFAATAAAVAA